MRGLVDPNLDSPSRRGVATADASARMGGLSFSCHEFTHIYTEYLNLSDICRTDMAVLVSERGVWKEERPGSEFKCGTKACIFAISR
jgi:hypothetical protein